ncbi:RNA methyltransferase, TrmH family, group 3 [Amylolactobacillus amylotrophicus DSM 20534]|uniref:RNA methyltransferase, TrmH family, group 3 n=3 Tax=Amylolactobacillus TaxID=2767876 RepID=A0A0R1YQG6_9LACO|nr:MULTISPECIES: 23S rRNA (guanosine(2251)-2'-O)-methyltransferase RlmB [Amylolactobacillus]APT18116.1 23S rRNA (guanosine(2251)-2'-O)-methyltransferase RlmB [Amylolactobacillus amylophilus DSM 20533 = JCM 1125]KRK37464.1 RNA methyltransferase, TrmH family, group 3 [Amylolactobacillus amylotrophicus DSM 20534]KRM42137.1 RNA methyltransferase, TrmH family, group 3 [Amylolactobacillus amylophilus DSM 20533 = JCM 1125]GED80522.1 23S rRNA (guanosine(2251)-2'-O)-methyltransferase RlmB [Amylolactobac
MDINSTNPDFVFGRHAAVDYLKEMDQTTINKVFLQSGVQEDFAKEVFGLAKAKGLVVQTVPKTKLDQLVDRGNHQGIVLAIASFAYADLDELLADFEARKHDPFILMLDGIEDPHNLGSILRTADATGVDAIIIPKHRATGLTGVVAKTSTGAIDHVPVARVTNLVQTVKKMKDQGYWFFGTAMNGDDYRQWNAKGKAVLVIGNEGKGISKLLLEQMDQKLTIPMIGHVQSLNAGVATGILLYQMFTSREG